MNNKVAVGVCLRPLAKSELDSGAENVVRIVDGKRVILSNDTSSSRYRHLLENYILISLMREKCLCATVAYALLQLFSVLLTICALVSIIICISLIAFLLRSQL